MGDRHVPTKIVLKSTTRMSLNDRFSTIRAPSVQQIRNQNVMDRMSSAKNLRLAQQMENRPSVMAALKLKQKSLKARLGRPNTGGNVKSRLNLSAVRGGRGRGRSPSRGRGGFSRGPRGMRTRGRGRGGQSGGGDSDLSTNRRGRGRGGNRGGFRGRGQSSGQSQSFTRGGGRGRGRGFGGRGRGRGRGRGGPTATVEDLDSQLDAYMSKTKGHLDADLDAYMQDAEME